MVLTDEEKLEQSLIKTDTIIELILKNSDKLLSKSSKSKAQLKTELNLKHIA